MKKLQDRGAISNPEIWSRYKEFVTKSTAVAMIDKLSVHWTSDDPLTTGHWVEPYVKSLQSKGVISNPEIWLENPDAYLSCANLLALACNLKGGMEPQYAGRSCDHRGRNYLDSLCDKGIITTPAAWEDFEGCVTRENFMALMCKVFEI